jgi:hypothetical protein
MTADNVEPRIALELEMVAALFEPWDQLDMRVAILERACVSPADIATVVADVVAAREELRRKLYPILRAYQAAMTDDEEED